MKIGFIGIGNMASAMVKGLLAAGLAPAGDVGAFDIAADKLEAACKQFGIHRFDSAGSLAGACEAVVLAVKPADFPALLADISPPLQAKNPLVISIAAGNTIGYIESLLGVESALVRVMPNINASIGESMTAYCGNARVSAAQLDFARQLCESFGEAVELDEKHFPAFGVLAGSAPAFAYLFIDELARAGVKIGMNKKLALRIAAQTVLGSAKMVAASGEHPYELIDRVCSPGGTTIEGIAALREHGFSNAVTKAVDRTLEKDAKLREHKGKD